MVWIHPGVDRSNQIVFPGSRVRIRGDHPYRNQEGTFEGFERILVWFGARVRLLDPKTEIQVVWVLDPREWEVV